MSERPHSSGDRLWLAWPQLMGPLWAPLVHPACLYRDLLWLEVVAGPRTAALAQELRDLSPSLVHRVNHAVGRRCVERIVVLPDPWQPKLRGRLEWNRAHPLSWVPPITKPNGAGGAGIATDC